MVPVKSTSNRPSDAPRPKVSVAMITYNHEAFISQAIESVMMQKTGFPYELVISDDCSPDRTREITLGLQRRYPNRIRLLLPETNLGMMNNFVRTLRACTGDYIALLEGDDYWIDASKLEKQARLLDAHPEFPACFTRARIVECYPPHGSNYYPELKIRNETFSPEDLLDKNHILTASVMYRNFIRDIDFTPFMSLSMGDWPLHILASLRGPIGFLPGTMAVYQLHNGGVWTSATQVSKLQATIGMYRALNDVLPEDLKPQLARNIAEHDRLIELERLREKPPLAKVWGHLRHYFLRDLPERTR